MVQDVDSCNHCITDLYQVNEKVDARDLSMGAWFEAQVVEVTSEATPTSNGAAAGSSNGEASDSTIYYHVKFDE